MEKICNVMEVPITRLLRSKTHRVPGVNNLGRFGRRAFAEFTDVCRAETDFEAGVRVEFNEMIKKAKRKKRNAHAGCTI